MQRLGGILMMVLILSLSAYNLINILEFQINQAIYLENCINKSSPELHCNGHCGLNTEFQEQNETNSANLPTIAENNITIFFSQGLQKDPCYQYLSIEAIDTKNFLIPEFPSGIFHPPRS